MRYQTPEQEMKIRPKASKQRIWEAYEKESFV